MVQLIVFVIAAFMVLAGGIGVVLQAHPVNAALNLVLTLFGVAVLFVQLHAEFLAAVQVIVYAGAIVVLFLFVIMLLGVDRLEDISIEPIRIQRTLAVIVGLGVVGLLGASIVAGRDAVITTGSGVDATELSGDENIRQLARSLFGDYVVAFELVSVLLIVAVVGTVVLTRRRRSDDIEGAAS